MTQANTPVLPQAYNGCTCICHTQPGVTHVMACCQPKRDFPNTRAAVVEYDAGMNERDRAWDAIESNDDVKACEERDKAALRKVQEVFHQDTSDINSLDHCYLVGINYLRQISKEGR